MLVVAKKIEENKPAEEIKREREREREKEREKITRDCNYGNFCLVKIREKSKNKTRKY